MRQALKEQLVEWLGPAYEPARDVFWSLFAWNQRTNLLWLAITLAIAVGVWALIERRRAAKSLRDLWRYLFPREIWAHPSARADYRFFLPDKLVYPFVFGWLSVSATGASAAILALVGHAPVEGAAEASVATSIAVNAAFTLASLVAFDLGYFIAHWLSHRVTILWEFHKVHHSAEVLTPITNYREHPLDAILQTALQGTLSGVVMALFTIGWPGVDLLTVLGVNAFQLPFFLIGNLRHSHVWLSFGWRASHFLSSPAQHQIHHGKAPHHIDVNYGLYLSIWDWLAGTLYVPRAKEQVEYGVVGEKQEYTTVWRMYWLPFVKSWDLIRSGRALSLMPKKGAAPPEAINTPQLLARTST